MNQQPPTKGLQRIAWIGVCLLFIGGMASAWAEVIFPQRPKLVSILNQCDEAVYWSYLSRDEAVSRQDFKGIVYPGEEAMVRFEPSDHLVFWRDEFGRDALTMHDSMAKIRIGTSGGKLVVRTFKSGETFP